ncbi:hypothetical protein H9I32_03250 [Bacillus sp. Xin]|uniref:hypothetical protein n=1 Tax=unclassified Bacillus (in: firmicutes) TaxID=185979 RepID=UPI001574D94C|nr:MULTISPECIES: hypothetical protein [unclassified Bacillus (in: firmicutes)]MBC6971476.1 hypothetical protein [Bacillus sp. Xin]NSW38577.1 hypothetical protein [Bacillus sp. Xin1]
MLAKKQVEYIVVLLGFILIIVGKVYVNNYEYGKYISGFGLVCWIMSAFLIPTYEPRKHIEK